MKNRSIWIQAPGEVRITDSAMPQRKPGQVLLKLLYGGICGSDLGSYRGTFAYFDYPRIPGHEFSAEILECDEDNAYGLKPGMIVTGNPYFNCGSCYSCRRGLVNACTHNETLGCQRDGVFSTYCVLPEERIYDGKGLSPKALAAIEPFCIGYHGANRASIQPGERVLVVGAGTIGVLTAMSAKSFGAEVTICDVAPDKLEMAKQFGVDHVLLNDENFQTAAEALTDGNGFDVAIEAVGLPNTFMNCIDAVCFGGRVVDVGVGKKNLDFFYTIIQKKELNIFGSRNALKSDFLELIDLAAAGKVDLEKIVTDVYDFEDAPRAFREFSEHAGEKLKVMLRF